jgi:adenylosuccinate synthase
VRMRDLLKPAACASWCAANLDELVPVIEHLGGTAPARRRSSGGSRTRSRRASGSRRTPATPGGTSPAKIADGAHVLFEGAQGCLLDLDHGTYPYVTSSSTIAAGACQSAGIGPTQIDSVVGITKAYATRVGAGPFPTELHGDAGDRLRVAGGEFGATTGRPRRCGWLDLPALRMGARLSGMSSLALTKLDVLANLPEVAVCVAYRVDGRELDEPPIDPDDIARAEPVYASSRGGARCRRGVRAISDLPEAGARLRRDDRADGGRAVLPDLGRPGPRRDHPAARPVRRRSEFGPSAGA